RGESGRQVVRRAESPAPERVAQGLAALAEGRSDHVREQRLVIDHDRRRGPEADLDHGRLDGGRRAERVGWDDLERSDLGPPLPEDRERAVLPAARRRGDALRHLALEHENRGVDRGAGDEEPGEDGLRRAVRQVPGDEDAAVGRGAEGRELLVGEAPRVTQPDLDAGTVRPRARRLRQPGLERRIDLERDQTPRARGEGPREGARAGTDLAHDVAGGRAHGLDDARRHARIDQEVLAERATAGRGSRRLGSGPPTGHDAERAARRTRCSARRAAWTPRTCAWVSAGSPELSTTKSARRTFSARGIWLATRRSASA